MMCLKTGYPRVVRRSISLGVHQRHPSVSSSQLDCCLISFLKISKSATDTKVELEL
jgi:hypothetical protein